MEKKKKVSFAMFLVTIGIVYGDIGTSPMYVMKSILEGNGGIAHVDEAFIVGSLSLVIWTITLLTTFKYVLIAMKADNHGEGGIFSLYALVKDCGKWLIVPAMLGGAALLADGLLTPAVTVTTAVEGLRSIELMDRFLGAGQSKVVIITLSIISLLFAVQHAGTSRIGKAFGPVMVLWFGFLGVTGLLHIFRMPSVLRPFAVVLGALAAVIASQALITGSYTLVSEAIRIDLLPHLEIRYPSDTKGQLYIPKVNSILWDDPAHSQQPRLCRRGLRPGND